MSRKTEHYQEIVLHTPEALPAILDWLSANGYKAVPVSELLLQGDTAIDHTGKQYKAR